MTDGQRNEQLDQIGRQRWEDFGKPAPRLTAPFPAEIPAGLDPITREFFEYYVAPRGHHPNSIGAFTMSSDMSFMNFPLMTHLESISPRPVLFIIGENAHSRYFSEDAYGLAAGPKELHVVPGARHIDLYDRVELIPFDKLEAFFKASLK